jgi:hypothetical protein
MSAKLPISRKLFPRSIKILPCVRFVKLMVIFPHDTAELGPYLPFSNALPQLPNTRFTDAYKKLNTGPLVEAQFAVNAAWEEKNHAMHDLTSAQRRLAQLQNLSNQKLVAYKTQKK